MEHSTKANHWSTIIDQYDASELTLAQFVAANEGIKMGTFQYWRKKLKRTRRQPQKLLRSRRTAG